MKFPSSLDVGSLLVFPTRSDSVASQTAYRIVRFGLKEDSTFPDLDSDILVVNRTVEKLSELDPESPLRGLLDAAGTLVPVPRSKPLKPHSLWPGRRIAEELLIAGFGSSVQLAIERVQPVPSSSQLSSAKERFNPSDHVPTLSVTPFLPERGVVTLVDDVVTRGSTLMACSRVLLSAIPGIEIQSFAVARVDTGRDLEYVSEMVDPTVEVVTLDESGSPRRRSKA